MIDPVRLRRRYGDHDETNVRRFQLTATLDKGSNAAATFMKWNGSAYVLRTSAGATFTAYDSMSLSAGISGDKGWVMWNQDSQRWEILGDGRGTATRRVQKTSAGNLKTLLWGGAAYAVTGAEFPYVDPLNIWPDIPVGFQGYASYQNDRAIWESLAPTARLLLGKTNAAHAKNASGTVNIWSGTLGSETSAGYSVTAYNKYAAVATAKFVWVSHNGTNGWYLTAMEC